MNIVVLLSEYIKRMIAWKSSAGKKMAGAHFTPITREPHTAHKKQRKPILAMFVPVLTTKCMLKDDRTFLSFLLSCDKSNG